MKSLARIGAAASALALGAGVVMVPGFASASEITATGTSMEQARSLYKIIAANDSQSGQDVTAAGCQKAEPLDDATKQAVLKSINAARELAGVKPVELLDATTYAKVWEDFQQGAIASAEADTLKHGLYDDNPCLPDYPGARDSTAYGNLAIGWMTDKVQPITGWTEDIDVSTFGHRISTLDPILTKYAFGIAHSNDVPEHGSNAVAVGLTVSSSYAYSAGHSAVSYEPLEDFPQVDRNAERPQILAWPSAGYFPAELAKDDDRDQEIGWTVEVPMNSSGNPLNGATVEILQGDTVVETPSANSIRGTSGMAAISFSPTKVELPTDGSVKSYTVRLTSADKATTWTYPVNLFEASKEPAAPETPPTTTAAQPTSEAPTTTPKATEPAPTTTVKPTSEAPTTTPKATEPAPTTTVKPTSEVPTTTPKATEPAPTTTVKPTSEVPTTTPKATEPAPTTTVTTSPEAPTPVSADPMLNEQFYKDAGIAVSGAGTKESPYVIPTKDKAPVTLSITLDPAAQASVDWGYAESVDATEWTPLPADEENKSLAGKVLAAADSVINSVLSLFSENAADADEAATGREVHDKLVDYVEGRVYRAHAVAGNEASDVYFVVTNTDSPTTTPPASVTAASSSAAASSTTGASASATAAPGSTAAATTTTGSTAAATTTTDASVAVTTTMDTSAAETTTDTTPAETTTTTTDAVTEPVATTTTTPAAASGKGSSLASTGSAGQQIALTAGALLIAGAVMFLVARRRKLSE